MNTFMNIDQFNVNKHTNKNRLLLVLIIYLNKDSTIHFIHQRLYVENKTSNVWRQPIGILLPCNIIPVRILVILNYLGS